MVVWYYSFQYLEFHNKGTNLLSLYALLCTVSQMLYYLLITKLGTAFKYCVVLCKGPHEQVH